MSYRSPEYKPKEAHSADGFKGVGKESSRFRPSASHRTLTNISCSPGMSGETIDPYKLGRELDLLAEPGKSAWRTNRRWTRHSREI